MHLYRLITFTILPLLAANPASATLQTLDRALYALEVSPKVLARVSAFRAEHDARLTSRQRDFLDETEATVMAIDLSRAGNLKAVCPSVFDADECSYILTGQHMSPEIAVDANESGLGKRQRECACSTLDDWCQIRIGPIWHCIIGGCASPGVWCGTLGFYNCNGICKGRF